MRRQILIDSHTSAMVAHGPALNHQARRPQPAQIAAVLGGNLLAGLVGLEGVGT